MKLKINFLHHLKMLTDLMVMSVVYFLIIWFLPSNDLKLMFFLLIPYLLMFFLPTIILHLNYFSANKGVVFEINKKEILKKIKNDVLKFEISDIDEIIIFTGGTRGTVSPGLAHSNYYYAKVKLLDKSNLIITSLYSSKIDKILMENFPNVKITTEKVFYPMI